MTFIPVFVSQSDLGNPMEVNAHQGSTFRRDLVCKWECPLWVKSGHSAPASRMSAFGGKAVIRP